MSVEASGATLNQRYVGSQAHFVDVPPGVEVIQGVKDDSKASEPRHVEVRFFDVCVMSHNFDIWVEFLGSLFGNERFGLFDMLLSEQELSVEIREVDRVQVDDVYLAEASEGEILQELTSDSSSANHEYSRLVIELAFRRKAALEGAFSPKERQPRRRYRMIHVLSCIPV